MAIGDKMNWNLRRIFASTVLGLFIGLFIGFNWQFFVILTLCIGAMVILWYGVIFILWCIKEFIG
jgi:type III secretory pathway component EscV